MIKQKKILVCSINPWNSKVGDNTFSSLLANYPRENIAQLFVREIDPDIDIAGKYFRLSESKVIESVFNSKIITGCIVSNQNQTDSREYDKQSALYHRNAHFYYPKLMLREIAWSLGKWKSKQLDDFIDSFKPDVILYEMSRYIHLNNIVAYIIDRSGAKGVGCFWDDTFTYKQENRLGYLCLRFFQRRNLKKLAGYTSSFFSITSKTKKEADEFFGINSTVLTKPIMKNITLVLKEICKPLNLLYTGNLGIGRLETLERITDAIRNKDDIVLDVYTNSFITKEEVRKLKSDNVRLHNAVPQQEVYKLQEEADVLLFIESFDPVNKAARLSFSTKITDYYAAGKCILAFGNADLAPIDYLVTTDSAIVCTSPVEIEAAIQKLDNPELLKRYASAAYLTGKKYHNYDDIKNVFDSVILQDND